MSTLIATMKNHNLNISERNYVMKRPDDALNKMESLLSEYETGGDPLDWFPMGFDDADKILTYIANILVDRRVTGKRNEILQVELDSMKRLLIWRNLSLVGLAKTNQQQALEIKALEKDLEDTNKAFEKELKRGD